MQSILNQVTLQEQCGPSRWYTEIGYVWNNAKQPMNSIVPTCFLPQFTHLIQLRDLNPQARFILNVRNLTQHIRSLKYWGGLHKQFVSSCPIFPKTDEGLQNWLQEQYAHVEEIMHEATFLKVRIDDDHERVAEQLANFTGTPLNRSRLCWGVTNRQNFN